MSDLARVKYELEKKYDGSWQVNVYSFQDVESPKAGLDMIKSMYMLEDPKTVDASINIRGTEALDLLFELGENI